MNYMLHLTEAGMEILTHLQATFKHVGCVKNCIVFFALLVSLAQILRMQETYRRFKIGIYNVPVTATLFKKKTAKSVFGMQLCELCLWLL